MPQAENQFGKYQLQERIAAGGMAEIYRARYQAAAGVTKPVVIKKILPHYAGNKNFISMFVNEARIAVGLSHGNIAQVFDFGEIDGEYFLAMEYVHGHPLSRVLRKARSMDIPTLPVPFAVLIALEMSKGLHYAHTRHDERGQPLHIVHRDVSPQNVILSYEGQVKIVDFGIAKARHASQTETETGAVKGKYVYFAPEQARGRELDARTDVFASGIVLYEMLCGKLPFEGKMMDVLGKIIRGDFPRPRSVNPDIPGGLEKIVLNAMASEKTARYQSAQEFQDALAQYLYSHAPTFSSQSLSALMSYLYEKELMAEGFPVRVPPDFLEQMSVWRRPQRFAEDERTIDDRRVWGDRQAHRKTAVNQAEIVTGGPADAQVHIATKVERGHEPAGSDADEITNPAAIHTDVDSRVPELESEPRASNARLPVPRLPRALSQIRRAARAQARRKWLLVALPLAAMILAAGIVVSVGYTGSFALQVTSDPSGAVVLIDGHPAPKKTPLLVNGLSMDGDHEVQVQLPGRKPFTQKVKPQRGTVSVNAQLEPDSGAP